MIPSFSLYIFRIVSPTEAAAAPASPTPGPSRRRSPTTTTPTSYRPARRPEPGTAYLSDSDSSDELMLEPEVLLEVEGEESEEVPANTHIQLNQVKQNTGRVVWKDYMKVQILEKYIDMAADPLKRPSSDKPKSKSVYREQIGKEGEIYNSTIMYMGEKTSLPSLCQPDTLHQFFGFRGLTGQTHWDQGLGLAALIDYVMHGKEQSKAVLMENKYEIMNLATLLSSDT